MEQVGQEGAELRPVRCLVASHLQPTEEVNAIEGDSATSPSR